MPIEIRDLCRSIIESQQSEIDQMKAMLELRATATGRGLTRPYWESDGQP